MADIKYEINSKNVLVFMMLNGATLAAEGDIMNVSRATTGVEPCPYFYFAKQPETGDIYLINLANVVAVQSVPRESVHIGPSKLVKPN